MSGNKKKDGNFLIVCIMLVFFMGAGYFIGKSGALDFSKENGTGRFLAEYILQLFLLFISFYIQIIIHECGHLAAGLMTGYRFLSFRIGSLMLLKTEEGYSFKRFSLAGTGGQCLLIPPDKRDDGTYPYLLYHSGGILINIITAVLFAALYRSFSVKNTAVYLLLYLSVTGILCAVTNGMPVRIGGIATDGYNAIHIGKDPYSLDAMWLQLKINEMQTEGIRLKDMPDEWFILPEEADKSNEIISTIAVFAENRAMDSLDFSKAKELNEVLENDERYSVIGLYRSLLLMDRITIDLIQNGYEADVTALGSRESKAFMKSMSKYPSVIRTQYAVQLLKNGDLEAAGKYRDKFDAVAIKYPVKTDIESEREIMKALSEVKC